MCQYDAILYKCGRIVVHSSICQAARARNTLCPTSFGEMREVNVYCGEVTCTKQPADPNTKTPRHVPGAPNV